MGLLLTLENIDTTWIIDKEYPKKLSYFMALNFLVSLESVNNITNFSTQFTDFAIYF